MARAFVFPGQGTQVVGMGMELAQSFPAARYIFQEVDEALGQHLTRLMFEGPFDELTLTENAQPALLAVSLAAVKALEEQGGIAISTTGAYVAGHSLGEYSALAAVDALSAGAAARLLKLRGRAMQAAVPVGKGAMAAIDGLDLDSVRLLAEQAAQGEVCQIANDNAPDQIVISGHKAAVERAAELAKGQGARRAVLLNVSAPFHCRLMEPAAEELRAALAETDIQPPKLPVVSNATAYALESPDEVRARLLDQVTRPVRWRESVAYMRDKGVTVFVEMGPGRVLCDLIRRIDPALEAIAISGPRHIEAFLTDLQEEDRSAKS